MTNKVSHLSSVLLPKQIDNKLAKKFPLFVEPNGPYLGVLATPYRDEKLDLCQGIRLPARKGDNVNLVSRYKTRRYLSCPPHRKAVSGLARTGANSTCHATLP